MWQENFQTQLAFYRSQHRTTGCKITHLIGVPLIAVSVPLALFSVKMASRSFVAGWILQFIGHYVYEKNRPVLFQEYGNPLVFAAALVFVTETWAKVLKGEAIADPEEITGNGSDKSLKQIRVDH